MYDLIVCIFGCDTIPTYKDQILKINETWGKLCKESSIKLLYFLGEEVILSGPQYIHLPGVKNDYESASYKQNLGLKYIHEHFEYKYVITCGTDTYINIKKLLEFINKYNYQDNLYIGGDHGGYFGSINNKPVYFHSGGPGIILSNGCMIRLYPYLENMFNEWTVICPALINACDVCIAYYTQHVIFSQVIKSPPLSMINCNYYGWPCHMGQININNIISCHLMSLSDFDEYTNYLNS